MVLRVPCTPFVSEAACSSGGIDDTKMDALTRG